MTMTMTMITPLHSNEKFTELAKINANIDGIEWLINQCDTKDDKELIKDYKKQIRELRKKKKEILGNDTEEDINNQAVL